MMMSNITLADAQRAKRLLERSKEFAVKEDYLTASLYMAEAARITGLLLEIPEFAKRYENWSERHEC